MSLRVPFVPTPLPVVHKMLQLAKVRPGELVYDLGAGDGRIIISAALGFGAKAVGVELHRGRFTQIKRTLERLDIPNAKVIRGDFFDVNLSRADVVTLYLLPSVNALLRGKLKAELKPGSRVVSHDFSIPGWKPSAVDWIRTPSGLHRVFLYHINPPGRRDSKGSRGPNSSPNRC